MSHPIGRRFVHGLLHGAVHGSVVGAMEHAMVLRSTMMASSMVHHGLTIDVTPWLIPSWCTQTLRPWSSMEPSMDDAMVGSSMTRHGTLTRWHRSWCRSWCRSWTAPWTPDMVSSMNDVMDTRHRTLTPWHRSWCRPWSCPWATS